MATRHCNWRTIIGRVALLGASLGIVLGLIEAAFLRFTDLPFYLLKPHVALSFWFFSPLLAGLTFGLVGLLAGALAALLRVRFLGMTVIACLAGVAAAYLALVVQFTQSAALWYAAAAGLIDPRIWFAGAFAWTWLALWATRQPGSPLGALAEIPRRLWATVVLGSIGVLAIAVGIWHFPVHATLPPAPASRVSQRSPNIVLILWDTTRADHLSSYGYSRNTTPNLDELARHGVLFENAIAASSWTLPSTFSIFTGLLPHQHGAGTDRAGEPRMLAEILDSLGYQTAGFNANPFFGINPTGLGRGFQTYVDSTQSMGYSLAATRIGQQFIEPYSERWFQRSRFDQFNAHQLNAQVYDWLNRRGGRPFFLFLNYNDAHDPYEVPFPYDHRYGHVSRHAKHLLLTSRLSQVAFSPGERDGVIAAYDDSLNYIDSQVGDLLRHLESSSEWRNTYVIFTSDHGEGFGEHHTYSHGWNLNREVLHVPLIVAGPGIPAGVRVNAIARTRQIFSTVLEFAGINRPILRRASLSRLWRPDYASSEPSEATLSELVLMQIQPWEAGKFATAIRAPIAHGSMSITTREWQLICESGFRCDQLYHWPTDLSEQQNVADLPENQAILVHLKTYMLSVIERSYRPWRDIAYLDALSGPAFSPVQEALKSIPLPSDHSRAILPLAPGSVQALFNVNAESRQPREDDLNKELLESLPYGGR